MFGKKTAKKEYDSSRFKPVLHCSICTGEQVAGFKNLETGKFEDVMLIKSSKDLDEFKRMYRITDLEKDY